MNALAIRALTLARLGCAPKGLASRQLEKPLSQVLGDGGAAERRQRLETVIAELRDAGLLVDGGRNTWLLSKAGERELCSVIQMRRLPRAPRWPELRRRALVVGLGLSAESVRSAKDLRRALVGQSHGLDASRLSEARLRDALAWQALGVSTAKPMTIKAIHAHLLGKLAGASIATTPETAMKLLAARVLGSPSADVWAAGLRKWAAAKPDGTFAERVLDAARRIPAAKRFGDDKVFIANVAEQLRVDDVDVFKRRLAQATRQGHLRLSRADLSGEMNPALVRASEVSFENATFHFIRL